MSLKNYQQLYSNSQKDTSLLGVNLPKLNSGYLSVNNTTLNADQVTKVITDFIAIQGWVMYSDSIEVTTQINSEKNIIEAQFNNGQSTLNVKLIGHNCYSVCTMQIQTTGQEAMAYKNQIMLVQKRPVANQSDDKTPAGNNLIEYRLWYKQQSTGAAKGRWEAFAQQFIGFTASQGK